MKKVLIVVVVLAVAAAVFLLKKVNESEGLEWSKLASEKMNFDDAAEYCENLKEGGYSDWYLPSVAELETIGRDGASKFGDVERFWSSTQWYLRSTDSGHWDFEFSSAYSQHMSYNNSGHYVRCVRGEISMLSTIFCKIPILQPISLLPITTKQNHKIHLFIDKIRQNCHDF